MKEDYIPLNLLPMGYYGKVKMLMAEGAARRRMLDLGLISDTLVEAIRKSPSGDPTAYQIRGAVIALRSEEASKILVEPIPTA
jgi:FeoA domain.